MEEGAGGSGGAVQLSVLATFVHCGADPATRPAHLPPICCHKTL